MKVSVFSENTHVSTMNLILIARIDMQEKKFFYACIETTKILERLKKKKSFETYWIMHMYNWRWAFMPKV